MYCRVLACDFDGTGASDGHLAPEVTTALRQARAQGITALLVTGRVLEDLRVALVDFSAFDAVVPTAGPGLLAKKSLDADAYMLELRAPDPPQSGYVTATFTARPF